MQAAAALVGRASPVAGERRRTLERAVLALILSGCGATAAAHREGLPFAEEHAPVADEHTPVVESPARALDDGTLPIAWELAVLGLQTISVSAAGVAVDSAEGGLLLEPDGGEVLARYTTPPRQSGFDDGPGVRAVHGVVMTEPEAHVLAAFDRGTELWRVPCFDPSFTACRARAFSAGDLVVITSGRSHRALRAFDPRTGLPRWEHEIDLGFGGDPDDFVADAARLYAPSAQHALLALDIATGAIVWRAECDAAYARDGIDMGRGPAGCRATVHADGHVAAVAVSGSQVLVLRAADGVIEHTIDANHALGMASIDLALSPGVLIAGGLAGDGEGAVVALDLVSGAVRWRCPVSEIVRVVVADGDDVWARGHRGTVWRISDGTITRTWGLRSGTSLVRSGTHLLLGTAEGVTALDPARATDPDPELRITGTAELENEEGVRRTAGVRVRVGDLSVVTADDGSFEAVVRARGAVYVWVEGAPPSPCDRTEEAFADGSAPVTVRRRERTCRDR